MAKTKKKRAAKKTVRKANPIPLGKFIRGEIRIVKKGAQRLIQFRRKAK